VTEPLEQVKDSSTRGIVEEYAANNTLWISEFVQVIFPIQIIGDHKFYYYEDSVTKANLCVQSGAEDKYYNILDSLWIKFI